MEAGSTALPIGEAGVPCPLVDPTDDELAAIDSVDAACAWAGVDDDLRGAFNSALGGTLGVLRHIVLVDRGNWDFAVTST